MIQTEKITINGKPFIRTYSDADHYVVRDGIAYSEAIDPAEYGRVYAEGDPIEEADEVSAEEALAELVEVLA